MAVNKVEYVGKEIEERVMNHEENQSIIVTDVGNAVCNWHAFYSKCVYT